MLPDRIQISTRDNGIATEVGNEKLIFKGQEVGSNKRSPGVVRVEGTNESGRFTSGVVFNVNRAFGEDGRTELVEGIGDEDRAALGDELRKNLPFGDNDEFISARVQVRENHAAGSNMEDSERGVEVGEEGSGLAIGNGDITSGASDDGTRGRVAEVERKRCVASVGREDLVARDGRVGLLEVEDDGGWGVTGLALLECGRSQGDGSSKKRKELAKHFMRRIELSEC